MTARLEAALAELGAAIRQEVAAAAVKTDGPPALLSVEAAARRLGIGRTSMYGLLAAGELRVHRIGRRTLIPADALAEFAANGRAGPECDSGPAVEGSLHARRSSA